MDKKISSKKAYVIAGSALIGSLLMAGTALAAGPGSWGGADGAHRAPGVFGTVSAISGNTITVSSKGFGQNATATTYTVDATNATVTKAGTNSTLAGIVVGDTIMAQGTVSGTSVTATTIRDGVMGGRGAGMGGPGMGMHRGAMPGAGGAATGTAPVIQGNGQPVVGGNVTAISGSTLTVTNKSNVTYSIDATSAKIVKGNAASSVSAITVGDNVIVQGTVNGTSIVASSVMDSGAPVAPSTTTGTNPPQQDGGGFLSGLGGFFHKLFGFF